MSSQLPTSTSSTVAAAGDTTLALATPVPYSSDGPTLPLIGHPHSNPHAAALPTPTKPSTNTRPQADPSTAAAASKPKPNPAPNPAFTRVQTPWTLLPPELRTALETRLGGAHWWAAHCVAIVYTRNQNIRSGINRLKGYLGCGEGSGVDEEARAKLVDRDGMIAVSGMGGGTGKVVGIVGLVRRVVGVGDGDGGGEGGGKWDKEVWCLYTSLAGVEEEGKGGGGAGDEDGEFEEKEDGRKTRKVPVLTAWMSRKSIPEFKRAFGEQTFEVWRPTGKP